MQLAYENREGSEEALFAILSKSLPACSLSYSAIFSTRATPKLPHVLCPDTSAFSIWKYLQFMLQARIMKSKVYSIYAPGKDYEIQSLVATAFGQGGVASNVVNASSNNVLLAIVDWVEGGIAPDVITGTGANGQTRNHCRYPQKSVFNGSVFICET
ncbi:hypothetical protein H2248_001765 [Termitomyces sp. 'cryptogamus']|nr:hypothetical protein H2248_001765 [Termitomyces sp. 'cryptogamus']